MTADRQMAMTTQAYASPLGTVVLAADDLGLTGLWFEGQKYFGRFGSTGLAVDRDVAGAVGNTGAHEQTHGAADGHIAAACAWLDAYFAGKRPPETPPLHLLGTPFQLEVWNLLLAIPYGQTTSYGALAQELERQRAQCAEALGQRPDGQKPNADLRTRRGRGSGAQSRVDHRAVPPRARRKRQHHRLRRRARTQKGAPRTGTARVEKTPAEGTRRARWPARRLRTLPPFMLPRLAYTTTSML